LYTYLLGPLLALLPRRWRARLVPEAAVDWPRAVLVSGLAECVTCLVALIGWYLYAIQKYIDLQVAPRLNLPRDVPGNEYAIGFAALIMVVTHPVSWALFYFWLEGAFRAFAALITEETPGSLPLVLMDRLIFRAQRWREEARVPLVWDEVARGDGKQSWDLKVTSCRPKPSWRYPLAISYEEEFFQVIGEALDAVTAERPHVYLLRRPHPAEALRGPEHYDPHDALREESEPGFFRIVFREVHKRWQMRRAPLVPDEIRNTLSREGSGLLVRGCRPKPEWSPGRLIRYKDAYYRVQAVRTDRPPRPFVFELMRMPAGVPSRSVLLYSPEDPLEKGG